MGGVNSKQTSSTKYIYIDKKKTFYLIYIETERGYIRHFKLSRVCPGYIYPRTTNARYKKPQIFCAQKASEAQRSQREKEREPKRDTDPKNSYSVATNPYLQFPSQFQFLFFHINILCFRMRFQP